MLVHLESRGVRSLELETEALARQIRIQTAVGARPRRTIEQHLLDAGVVPEVFDMLHAAEGAAGRKVERRRGMRGQWDGERVAESGDFEKTADAHTARGVGVQHVNRTRFRSEERRVGKECRS